MTDIIVSEGRQQQIRRADSLQAAGQVRAAIDLLTAANRVERHTDLERALVRLRREGAATVAHPAVPHQAPLPPQPATGSIVEVEPRDLDLASLRAGLQTSGCLLVRGLVDPGRAATLVAGIDVALDAYDTALSDDGRRADVAWYDPGPMPDRMVPGLPEDLHRQFLRSRGSLWTVDAPRMLFLLFELIDELGIGALMTDFLGERPLFSALKGTMRRMPPDVEVDGRWHQDGAFLGNEVGALNLWVALTPCGVDAPGLDIVPRRLAGVLPNDGARFDWAVSEAAVEAAADGVSIVRPELEAGDALLFDHLLLHRTGASARMTGERHAIESWFFAPSAYPVGQLPILY